jgi:hypothetical protein
MKESQEVITKPALYRDSFKRWAENVRIAQGKGGDNVVITYDAQDGTGPERIDISELESPKSGIYSASVPGIPGVAECKYIAREDRPPKEPERALYGYMERALETAEARCVRAENQREVAEGKLSVALSEKNHLADENRRLEEENAALRESQDGIFDESIIELLRVLFGEGIGFADLKKTQQTVWETIEKDPVLSRRMLSKHPEVILRMSAALGIEGDEPDAGVH